MSRPRILFLDAYDSFTNNIVSLVETELGVDVTTIRIDSKVDLNHFVSGFDAVIAGPGPGSPHNASDVGLISQLWCLDDLQIRPVLGICLGFQSLVCTFGGRIERLSKPRHGISTQIETCESTLFEGMQTFESIQYHSLRASIGSISSKEMLWKPTSTCPELQPLAWDFSSESIDGPILMGVGHLSKPFWAVQFHPESVCSSKEARKVIRNWWALCQQWTTSRQHHAHVHKLPTYFMSDLDHVQEASGTSLNPSIFSHSTTSEVEDSPSPTISCEMAFEPVVPENDYFHDSMPVGPLEVTNIIDILGLGNKDLIILDSEKRLMPGLGRYSIIAFLETDTTRLFHRVGENTIRVVRGSHTSLEEIESTKAVFAYLKRFLGQSSKVERGLPEIPFWGGLMGYITYEACLETIDVESVRQQPSGRDDICFAFVERSIVIDHVDNKLYVQSIKFQDKKWPESILTLLKNASGTTPKQKGTTIQALKTRLPDQVNYKSKIAYCKEQIRAGNSYELCLTNQANFTTLQTTAESTSSWAKYQTLRNLNPAPFASYIRLGSATILSTSPERFMHCTRPVVHQGQQVSTCQFRPIKGTVQKRVSLPDGSIRNVSLQEASTILSTPKEMAENLMIVDLIRHDLHGIVGSGNVCTRSLMQIEEYNTVYQLVSVIEGTLISNSEIDYLSAPSGIDVLSSSLPPGSMTGAPKKRSCEILLNLEDELRSVYSGVIGYICVGGGIDFSVTIRTVFKWDDEDEIQDNGSGVSENWRIGAGGAITVLSDLDDEWNEMKGKLASTMRLFQT